MAEHSDGSIIIDTELDQTGFEAGSKELLKAIKSLTTEIKQLNAQFGSVFAKTGKAAEDSSGKVEQLESQLKDLRDQVDSLNTALKNTEKQINKTGDKDISGAFNMGAAKQSMSDFQKELNSLDSDLSKLESSADKAIGATTTPLERFNDLADSIRQKIDDLSDKMAELENTQIPTEDYAWTEQEIKKAETELDKLIAKQDKMDDTGVKHSSKAYQNLQYDIDQTKKRIDDLQATQQILKDNGEAYVSGADTEQYAQYESQLKDAQSKFADLCAEVDRFYAKANSLFTTLGQMIGSAFAAARDKAISCLKSILGEIKNLAGKGVSLLTSQVKKAALSFLGLGKSSKSANAGFGSSLKNILKYTFGIRSLFVLVNKLRAALVSGFGNLAQYSSSTNKAISSITSALTQLKNSLASAFDPILQAAAPALTYLIGQLASAVSYIGMFTAALSGQTVYKKATTVQEDYAKSLDKTAKSAKEANQQVAGIDELNIISDTSSSGKDDGSVDPSQMFEEVPIDTCVTDFVDRLKKAFADGDFTELGKIIGEKINDAFQSIKDFIDWDNVGGVITKWVNALCNTINSMVDTIDWDLIGSTFASGVNTIVNTAHLLLTGIDWENIGKAIATGLNAAIRDIDWAKLGQTIGEYFEAKLDVLHGVVTNFNWRGLGAAIGTSLTNTFAAIDWKKAGETISAAFIGVFDSLTATVAAFDWRGFGEDIKTFITNIDFAGIATSFFTALGSALGGLAAFLQSLIGDAWDTVINWWHDSAYDDGQFTIQGLFEGIKKALSDVAAWIKANIFDPFINGFKNIFGIHSPSTVMAELGGYIMEGLKNGITNGISTVVNAVKDLPAKIIEKFTDIQWPEIGKNVILGIGNGIQDTVGKLSEAASKASNWLVNAFKNALDIHSPSKLFYRFGEYINEGLANGITESLGYVQNAMTAVVDTVQQQGDNAVGYAANTATGWIDSFCNGLDNQWQQIDTALKNDFVGSMQTLWTAIQNGDIQSLGKWAAAALWESIGEENRTQLETFAKDLVSGVSGVLKDGIGKIASAAKSFGDTIVNSITSNLPEITNRVTDTVTKLLSTFSDMVQPLGNTTTAASTAMSSGFLSKMPEMLAGAGTTIGTIASAFVAMLQTIGASLSAFGIPTGPLMIAAGVALVAAIGGIVASLGGRMTSSSKSSKSYSSSSNTPGNSSSNKSGTATYTSSYATSSVSATELRDAVYNGTHNALIDTFQRYSSFTSLLDRLNSIANRVTFTTPAAATGTVMPYDVAAKATGESTALTDTITSSNEELGSVVVQSITTAATAIVDAIQQYSGKAVTVYLDGKQITAAVEKTQKDRGIPIMGTEVYSY